MGWQYSLILVGLAFVGIVGVALHLEARAVDRQFVSNKRLNQFKPGAFQIGKDVK